MFRAAVLSLFFGSVAFGSLIPDGSIALQLLRPLTSSNPDRLVAFLWLPSAGLWMDPPAFLLDQRYSSFVPMVGFRGIEVLALDSRKEFYNLTPGGGVALKFSGTAPESVLALRKVDDRLFYVTDQGVLAAIAYDANGYLFRTEWLPSGKFFTPDGCSLDLLRNIRSFDVIRYDDDSADLLVLAGNTVHRIHVRRSGKGNHPLGNHRVDSFEFTSPLLKPLWSTVYARGDHYWLVDMITAGANPWIPPMHGTFDSNGHFETTMQGTLLALQTAPKRHMMVGSGVRALEPDGTLILEGLTQEHFALRPDGTDFLTKQVFPDFSPVRPSLLQGRSFSGATRVHWREPTQRKFPETKVVAAPAPAAPTVLVGDSARWLSLFQADLGTPLDESAVSSIAMVAALNRGGLPYKLALEAWREDSSQFSVYGFIYKLGVFEVSDTTKTFALATFVDMTLKTSPPNFACGLLLSQP